MFRTFLLRNNNKISFQRNYSTKYFKVTPYDKDPRHYDSRCSFTTLDHIPKFYRDGHVLQEIIVPPSGEPVKCEVFSATRRSSTQYESDVTYVKYILTERHGVIVGNAYSLFDPDTYSKFGLDIKENEFIVSHAIRQGDFGTLGKLKELGFMTESSNLELVVGYPKLLIDKASNDGNVKMLDSWIKSGIKLEYSHKSMDGASAKNSVKMLNWWKNSGLVMKYSTDSLYFASAQVYVDVLCWWANSEFVSKNFKKLAKELHEDAVFKKKVEAYDPDSIVRRNTWWDYYCYEPELFRV